jgi:hypothetical protein
VTAAAILLVSSTVWLIWTLAGLDPDDNLSGEAAAIAFYLYIALIVFALVVAGAALVFLRARPELQATYFGVLGLACLGMGLTLRGSGLDLVAYVFAAGAFSLAWRQLAPGWGKPALVGAAVVAGVVALAVVPALAGILAALLVVAVIVFILMAIRRGSDRRDRARRSS